MPETTISEPFSLASYALPSRALPASSSQLPLVYASTSTQTQPKKRQFATLTNQGDGIHILDLSTLHPTTSYTLGPSTFFSAPAFSRILPLHASSSAFNQTEKEAWERTTYAIIESSPDIPDDERGRTVWRWTEAVDGSAGKAAVKTGVVAPHEIKTIRSIPAPSTNLVLLSSTGLVTLTTSSLVPIESPSSTSQPPSKRAKGRSRTVAIPTSVKLLKSWVIPLDECGFISASTFARRSGALLVRLLTGKISSDEADRFLLKVGFVSEDGRYDAEEDKPVDFCEVLEDVLDVSFSPTGILAVITRSGHLHTFSLSSIAPKTPSDSPFLITAAAPALLLSRLSFIPSPPSPNTPIPPAQFQQSPVSILALNTSLMLLASISTNNPHDLVFQIWDLQYSVLLDVHTHPLPSSLSSTSSKLRFELVSTSSQQAILIISPLSPEGSSKSSKSLVLVVPYTAPSSSTLGNAIGKAHFTSQWLFQPPSEPKAPPKRDKDGAGARTTLIEKVKELTLAGEGEEANKAFFEWVVHETRRLAKIKLGIKNESALVPLEPHVADGEVQMYLNGDVPLEGDESGMILRMLQGVDEKKRKKRDEKVRKRERTIETLRAETNNIEPELSYTFTSSLLGVSLSTIASPNRNAFPSKIVQYLVEKGAVSNVMHAHVDGGLLGALTVRQDWTTVKSILRHVRDVPETELVALLQKIISLHRVPANADADAMQLDTSQHIPTLRSILSLVVSYPISKAPLRQALKKQMPDVEDVVILLDVFASWTEEWEKKMTAYRLPGVKEGGAAPKHRIDDKLPPFERILVFLQATLDAHFLALLQHPPAREVIKRLSTHVRPQIEVLEETERIQSFFEPFIRRAVVVDEKDAKKRVREMRENDANVGLYRFEELVI